MSNEAPKAKHPIVKMTLFAGFVAAVLGVVANFFTARKAEVEYNHARQFSPASGSATASPAPTTGRVRIRHVLDRRFLWDTTVVSVGDQQYQFMLNATTPTGETAFHLPAGRHVFHLKAEVCQHWIDERGLTQYAKRFATGTYPVEVTGDHLYSIGGTLSPDLFSTTLIPR